MNRNLRVAGAKTSGNLVKAIKNAMSTGGFKDVTGAVEFDSTQNTLAAITGTEAFSNQNNASALNGLSDSQRYAMMSSVAYANGGSFDCDGPQTETCETYMKSVYGAEGFSLTNYKGDMSSMKAPSITLNALSHRQTKSAEALYPTVTIPYRTESIQYSVRTAGLGQYVYGASAFTKSTDLTPVTSILRDSDFFLEDSLGLHPVYPANPSAKERTRFVSEADFAPWDVTYAPSDPLHRQSHRTNYLKVPANITNLLGLSQVPGQDPFDTTDEIESNSIKLMSLLVNVTTDAGEGKVVINTSSMSNNSLSPSSQQQSSDDRSLSFVAKNLEITQFVDPDTKLPSDLFASMTANGYKPLFMFSMNATYQRNYGTLQVMSGVFELTTIKDKDGKKYQQDTDNAEVKALFALFEEGVCIGADWEYNQTNIARSNFGYRVETYDATKTMSVRRFTPISIKFPVSKEDVNDEALNYAVEQMAVIINAQMSATAFTSAAKHFDYVRSINGSEIVGNDQASNVLAGQHFVQPTAVYRELALKDIVSTENNNEAMNNISNALVNTLAEMAAAIATNSGLSAIQEYNGVDELEWTIISHQNLARYLFRTGDSRTLGNKQKAEIQTTCYDSMIGKFYIVPKSKTSGDIIDPLGGIGINVSKEDVVVQANMTRDNRDFGVILTQPSFQHHDICPLIGLLYITDAQEALQDGGLIDTLTQQRVAITNIGDAGAAVPAPEPSPTPPNA